MQRSRPCSWRGWGGRCTEGEHKFLRIAECRDAEKKRGKGRELKESLWGGSSLFCGVNGVGSVSPCICCLAHARQILSAQSLWGCMRIVGGFCAATLRVLSCDVILVIVMRNIVEREREKN